MRCPKCGCEMLPVPDSGATNDGVTVMDVICQNCLHVEQATFIVARRDDSAIHTVPEHVD